MKRKNLIVISLIVILLLVTLGVSVAFFSYLKLGDSGNTITLGDLKFHYTEITGIGHGINLVDPLPITDSEGKVLSNDKEYFEFSIESNTIKSDIEYEVVVEPTNSSTMSLDGIKFYLTEVLNNSEKEIEYSINEENKVKTLNEYNDTSIENATGKTVYSETIARNTRNYYKKFRARIWISEDIDWTDEGYIGKTGSFKINVYAKGKVTNKQLTLKETVLYNSNGGDTLTELPDSSFTRISNDSENGLFKSTKTNTGKPTYYYRGNVDNNWVSFAGQLWRIVRVNEDGTVRLIMQDGINNNTTYAFSNTYDTVDDMYYSNSDVAKPTLDTWYQTNITNEGYNFYVAKGNYFCEQAKVAWSSSYLVSDIPNMKIYSEYSANYTCTTDTHNHGLINSSVGMLSYDETVFAGGYYNTSSNYYLKNQNYWTISTAGYFDATRANIWKIINTGALKDEFPLTSAYNVLRPVINIKENVKVTGGTGIQTDPYVIGTVPVYESLDKAIASVENPGNLIMCDGTKGKLSNCSSYNDLATAVASRDKGTIIVMADTVTLSSWVTIAANKEIVLELNGKTIQSSYVDEEETTSSNSHGIFDLRGSLVVNDRVGTGKMETGITARPIYARYTGKLVINGGTYIGRQAIAINNENPEVIINGGTFTSKYNYPIYNNAQNGVLTLNGGTFYIDDTATATTRNLMYNNNGATININGGTYISEIGTAIMNYGLGTINLNQTDTPIYIRVDVGDDSKSAIYNRSSGTINIKANKANACTDDPSDTTSGLCIYTDRDANNNTRNAYGIGNASSGTINIDGGTYRTYANTFSSFGATKDSKMTIANVDASSSNLNTVKNNGSGTIYITSGKYISQNSYAVLNNKTDSVIKIKQTSEPLYIYSKYRTITNGGTISIKANKANACTPNADDTTSGLCVYADYNSSSGDNSNAHALRSVASGKTYVDGGTYFGDYNAIISYTGANVKIKNADIISPRIALSNNSDLIVCDSTARTINNDHDIYHESGATTTYYNTTFINTTYPLGTDIGHVAPEVGTLTKANKCPF